jgi:uncharacterized membrane protein (UPF0127 family)
LSDEAVWAAGGTKNLGREGPSEPNPRNDQDTVREWPIAPGPSSVGMLISRERVGRLVGWALLLGGVMLLVVAAASTVSSMFGLGEMWSSDGLVPSDRTAALFGGHSPLCLEVAADPAKRALGLSKREAIGPYDGMVFIFPEVELSESPFWMKDTRFALDLVVVGPDGRVSEILPMEPCADEECPLYRPQSPYLFAVELPAGWASQFGLEVGSEAKLAGGCLPIDRD